MNVPFVLIVGRALNASFDAVGPMLFRRGAHSVLGPCAIFVSLDIAGTDFRQAEWYRTLFTALLRGRDVGASLREARQAMPADAFLKYAWLITGTSLVSFVA